MEQKQYFYSFNQYLRKKYPFKVRKISLDAGFTCPNRDGTKATGGCIYCENCSFSPNSIDPQKSIKEQIEKGIDFYQRNFKAEKFIFYFQAYTNTYGSVDLLKKIYDQALEYPDVVAISIGTRPDCVSDKVLDLIESYTQKVDVCLELGLQSIHNSTLKFINRAHTYEDFKDALNRARGRGIELCTHIIFGLPSETYEMMMQTADEIADWELDSIKIHHLYIAKNTVLEKLLYQGQVKVFTSDEWVRLVADVLERIPPKIVIQRLVGELHSEYLIAPKWGKSKNEIIKAIESELEKRASHQGKLYDLKMQKAPVTYK